MARILAAVALVLALRISISYAIPEQQPLYHPSSWRAQSIRDPVVTTPYTDYDTGLFTPLEDLGALSASEYTTRLVHPAFPRHSVRVKQSHFCDETVR